MCQSASSCQNSPETLNSCACKVSKVKLTSPRKKVKVHIQLLLKCHPKARGAPFKKIIRSGGKLMEGCHQVHGANASTKHNARHSIFKDAGGLLESGGTGALCVPPGIALALLYCSPPSSQSIFHPLRGTPPFCLKLFFFFLAFTPSLCIFVRIFGNKS